jgi:hypothetical protein
MKKEVINVEDALVAVHNIYKHYNGNRKEYYNGTM